MSSVASVLSDESTPPRPPSNHTRKALRSPADLMMNEPAVVTSTPSAVTTPSTSSKSKQARAERAKIEAVPLKLALFLQPDIKLKSFKPATRLLIQSIILHFDPEAPVKDHMTRPTLISLFDIHVAPVLRKHPHTSAVTLATATVDASGTTSTHNVNTALFAHTLLPDFDPHHRNSKKEILKMAIAYKKPGIVLSNPISKDDLATLFERYVHLSPPQMALFSVAPCLLTANKLPGQTRDELHFAIRCHRPDVYVRVASGKEILVNVYQRLLLGVPDSADDCAHVGVDFFIRVKYSVIKTSHHWSRTR